MYHHPSGPQGVLSLQGDVARTLCAPQTLFIHRDGTALCGLLYTRVGANTAHITDHTEPHMQFRMLTSVCVLHHLAAWARRAMRICRHISRAEQECAITERPAVGGRSSGHAVPPLPRATRCQRGGRHIMPTDGLFRRGWSAPRRRRGPSTQAAPSPRPSRRG